MQRLTSLFVVVRSRNTEPYEGRFVRNSAFPCRKERRDAVVSTWTLLGFSRCLPGRYLPTCGARLGPRSLGLSQLTQRADATPFRLYSRGAPEEMSHGWELRACGNLSERDMLCVVGPKIDVTQHSHPYRPP